MLPGRLNEYDIQKPVGKGGYAIVYKAIRRSDGRIVAVKKVEVRGRASGGLPPSEGGVWTCGTSCRYGVQQLRAADCCACPLGNGLRHTVTCAQWPRRFLPTYNTHAHLVNVITCPADL